MSRVDSDQRPLDLLGRCCSGRIAVSIRILDVGAETAYRPDDWKDSIIEIEAGAVEIETRDGEAVEFRAGDVFWLAGLPVLALHNRGDVPAVLVTATRRRAPQRRPAASAEHPTSGHEAATRDTNGRQWAVVQW